MSEKIHGLLKRTGIINLAINSIFYSASLAGGFFLVKYFYLWRDYPLFWGNSEIIFSTLSFLCCYLFTSILQVKKHEPELSELRIGFSGLTQTYMTFAAIMFFMSTFFEARFALIIGYLISNVVLYLNVKYLSPLIDAALKIPAEGSKRLVIKTAARKSLSKVSERTITPKSTTLNRTESSQTKAAPLG